MDIRQAPARRHLRNHARSWSCYSCGGGDEWRSGSGGDGDVHFDLFLVSIRVGGAVFSGCCLGCSADVGSVPFFDVVKKEALARGGGTCSRDAWVVL